MNEGPQIFHFANNETYETFYYDKTERNRISRRLCSRDSYDQMTYTINEIFQIKHLSNEFHDCLNYIENYQENRIDKYIKCKIIKNVTCGQKIVLHNDKNDAECKWNLNKTTSKFTITIHNKKNVATNSHSIPNQPFGATDLIGYLACKIDNTAAGTFKIEEPFVLRKDDVEVALKTGLLSTKSSFTDMADASGSSNPLMIALICVCLGGVGISLFVYLRNRNIVASVLKPR